MLQVFDMNLQRALLEQLGIAIQDYRDNTLFVRVGSNVRPDLTSKEKLI